MIRVKRGSIEIEYDFCEKFNSNLNKHREWIPDFNENLELGTRQLLIDKYKVTETTNWNIGVRE